MGRFVIVCLLFCNLWLGGFGSLPEARLEDRYLRLVVVNDYARYKLSGQSTHEDTELLLEETQRIFDNLASVDGAAYHVHFQLVHTMTLRSRGWWEYLRAFNYEEVYSQFAEWLSYRNDHEIHGEFPEYALPILLTASKTTRDGLGYSMFGGSNILDGYGSAIVVNAQTNSIPVLATRLARFLARSFSIRDDHDMGGVLDKPCVANPGAIMDPEMSSNSPASSHWSKCSREWITIFFDQNEDSLATESMLNIAEPSSCGNGVVDEGEECDCIGFNCDPCCDLKTCRLQEHAECSIFDGCCNRQCKVQARGTVCRARNHETCDVEETCDGVSSTCPDDEFVPTSTQCFTTGYYKHGSCLAGDCIPSLNQQCRQRLFSEECSVEGYAKFEDSGCGFLKCKQHFSEEKPGSESCVHALTLSHDFIPVPDGTRCGQEGVCMQHRCVEPERLQRRVPSTCFNGIRDGFETDVDCGGVNCAPCGVGERCLLHTDCAGGYNARCDLKANICVLKYSKTTSDMNVDSDDFISPTAVIVIAATVVLITIIGTCCTIYYWFGVGNPTTSPSQQNRGSGSSSSSSAAVRPNHARNGRRDPKIKPRYKNHSRKKSKPFCENSQPDVLNVWLCPACDMVNNGLMVHCEKCNELNPADRDVVIDPEFVDIDLVPEEEDDIDEGAEEDFDPPRGSSSSFRQIRVIAYEEESKASDSMSAYSPSSTTSLIGDRSGPNTPVNNHTTIHHRFSNFS